MGAIGVTRPHIPIMENFDFTAPAEVYGQVQRGSRRLPMVYRKFDTGAEAVRYAIEVLGAEGRTGTVIETDELRLTQSEIQALYDDPAYPLRDRVAG